MDPAAIDTLSGPVGDRIFAGLPARYDAGAALRAQTTLRDLGYPGDLVAAALTQWELRAAATAKFGAASSDLFFTRDGLEQSTRGLVAELHAGRLAGAGVHAVWDLGCGIGGDAMAFRRRGMDVTAVEADPLTAAVAAANLARAPGMAGGVRVRTEPIEVSLAELADGPGDGRAVWLDPARRVPGVSNSAGRARRITSREAMSPPWEVVMHAVALVPSAGVKVGVSFNADSLPAGCQAQWVSVDGAALECVLWWGHAASLPGMRSASVYQHGRWHHLVAEPRGSGERLSAGGSGSAVPVSCGSYVYEVDPAVAAAGLRGRVCEEVGGRPLGMAAYAWSLQRVATPWARCWQVEEVLPLSVKTLRSWARQHEIGALTLKKPPGRSRSPLARLDPEELRRGIGPRGSNAATLLLTETDDDGTTVALRLARVS